MKERIFLFVSILALSGCARKPGFDVNEVFGIGYSDVVSYIVQGYQCHWEGMNPEEMGISDVYCYESEYGGCARMDIDGDGFEELLLGDDFGDGNYQIYDVYGFDKNTGDTVHLLSGGERDFFVINGDGVIIEHGSNSASDSFEKYYKIRKAKLVVLKNAPSDLAPAAVELDRFIRYVAPSMFVVLRDDEPLGQLIKTMEDCYEIETQEITEIPKEGVEVRHWSAYDGKGVVYPKNPGTVQVYAEPSADAQFIGEIKYEEGFCPDTFKCLGYVRDWFRIEYNGVEGYVEEKVAEWDFADRF